MFIIIYAIMFGATLLM